ncbi:hypothetical protein [Flavobacterium sp.]|uniref:hypothetical protein n=1 Tax=Flavobacterium sp. TaxID=239 RepID=UPI003752D853
MENLKIKLATGKIITIEAFHFTKTYGGLLTGEPSKEINEEIIKNISYPKNWGQRRAVFDRKDWYLSNEVLKPITYSAWLMAESIDDKEKQYDGSSIIVIWIDDEPKGKDIEEIIVSGIGLFDWEKFAENYQF